MVRVLLIPSAALVSAVFVYGIRRWAERRNVMDVPNQRSSHSQATPRGGGLAIVAVTLGGLLIHGVVSSLSWRVILSYAIGSLLIAFVSWLDDLGGVGAFVRLAVHGAGALLVIVSLGAWKTVDLPMIGELQLGWLAVPLTLLWIVGLTNAYNFMDGIDGIAGLQALIAGCGWAATGWYLNDGLVSVTGLLLAGSSLGFLGQNWPPAKIFMGDVGSAFLGYTCAVLPVVVGRSNPRMIVVGFLLVWPFVFDATLTMLRRLRRGENVFSAHRSHLYQRLVIVGFSHRFVSLLYGSLSIAGGALAAGSIFDQAAGNAAVAITLPLLCFGLWVYVVREEHRRSARSLSGAKV